MTKNSSLRRNATLRLTASTTLLATAAVAGLGVVWANPAAANPTQTVTSFVAGTAPASLTVSWTADNTDPTVYIAIAKAAAFSPTNPCDYDEWDTASVNPANSVGYIYQGSAQPNPREFTTYDNWAGGQQFTVEASTQYVACYFDEGNVGSGTHLLATSSIGDPAHRNLAFSDTEFIFPVTPVGQSASTSVTVTSSGTEAITVTSLTVEGLKPSDYSQSTDCIGVLAPAATCTITVTFSPTIDGRNISFLRVGTDSTVGRAGGGIFQLDMAAIGYGSCAAQPFAGGTGTPGDPYLIETLAQFNCISAADSTGAFPHLGSDFRLEADLDAGGVLGALLPASTWWDALLGEFDGNDHVISNVVIDDIFGAVFPWLDGAHVHDLVIRDAQVTTRFEGAIVAGGMDGGALLERVTIDGGSLIGTSGSANGAAAGYMNASQIDQVSSSASVSIESSEESAYVGGLVGKAEAGSTITRSYATGSVAVTANPFAGATPNSGVTLVGGLAGVLYGGTAISDSFATGAVTMTHGQTETYVGGLVGSVEDAGSSVEHTYASGLISAPDINTSHAHGLAGRSYGSGAVTGSLWDTTSTGITAAGVSGTTGLTTAQMQDIQSYLTEGWSIEEAPSVAATWTIPTGSRALLSWAADLQSAPNAPSTPAGPNQSNDNGAGATAPSASPSPSPTATVAPVAAEQSAPDSSISAPSGPLPSVVKVMRYDTQPATARVNAPSATLGSAPIVTVKPGQPVRVSVGGMTPGATYVVKMRTGKRPYASLGSTTASKTGSLRLPTWTASTPMKSTLAIVGEGSAPRYVKVTVGQSTARGRN